MLYRTREEQLPYNLTFSKIQWLFGAINMLIMTIVYFRTLTPTVPFWDAGEFIACAKILGIPHPPGYPFYVLVGRLFSLLPCSPTALWLNAMSTVFTVIAFIILYHLFLWVVRQLLGEYKTLFDAILGALIAITGLYFFAFSATNWENSIEAEVYGANNFFIVLFMFLIIYWAKALYEKPKTAKKILYLFIYLFGLSLGSHQSMVPVGGALILIGLFVDWRSIVNVEFVLLAIFFFMFGFSMHFYLLIRSRFNPLIDETNPETWDNFIDCLLRKQYKPAILKRSWTALMFQIGTLWRYHSQQFTPIYSVVEKYNKHPLRFFIYLITLSPLALGIVGFIAHLKLSKMWDALVRFFTKENKIRHIVETVILLLSILLIVSTGEKIEKFFVLTFTILAIVILIEIGYLMRNVKEIQSVLTFWVFLAIFLTGHFAFPILMNVPSMEDNGDSINAYTIKAAFGHKKPVQENGLKANYFGEVRDRDYFFIASYMIYALWMGLGAGVLIKWLHNEANKKGNIKDLILALKDAEASGDINSLKNSLKSILPELGEEEINSIKLLEDETLESFIENLDINYQDDSNSVLKILNNRILYDTFEKHRSLSPAAKLITTGAIIFMFIISLGPLKFFFEEKDRTGNFIAHDYAWNILASCEQDGIVFTNGDNDTFPLWFLQCVKKYRRDVNVINLSLLNTDWYNYELQHGKPDAPSVPLKYSDLEYQNLPAGRYLRSDYTLESVLGRDTLRVMHRKGKVQLLKNRSVFDMIKYNKWKRPIYFAVTVADLMGLRSYLPLEGLVFKLGAKKAKKGDAPVNPDRTYESLYEIYRYKGMYDDEVYKDRNSSRLVSNYAAAYSRMAYGYQKQANKLARTDPVKANSLNSIILMGLEDALKAAPHLYQIRKELVSTYARMGKNDEAEVQVKVLMEIKPDDPRYFIQYAQLRSKKDDNATAVKTLEDWIVLHPNHPQKNQIEQFIKIFQHPKKPKPIAPKDTTDKEN